VGINKELKLQLIMHHNKNNNIDDFFIQLLKVSDSLGNFWELGENAFCDTGMILRVGDEIEFIIDAYNPKGVEIEYKIFEPYALEIKDDKNKINFVFNQKMIGKLTWISISVEAKNNEYKDSAMCQIKYSIIP